MNKDTFLRLVQNPHSISDDDLEKLEDVTKIFPYCSLAYMLIAQGHFEHASMLASQKLRQAATYALDRETLKNLLIGEDFLEKAEKQKETPAIVVGTNKPESQEKTTPELDALMSESSRVYMHDQLLEPVIKTRQDDRFKILDSTDEETPALQLGRLNEDEAVVERFSQRLKKSVQRDIIDSFIKSEPRISTLNLGEKDAFTDRDLSEKSTRPPEIISENLANILIKQGKIDKAIEMYEKLILKFPQKKSYFASRIEDLKNL
ncbi:tetratricopeptide repeat protein [Cytophagaceae bacterium DM2B3-1]|uniref:Tetratricopeptide repeat protein n=1 Tax=Xanthocytophaga flava TaxID=3048013 RepID=A0ABT7CH51_9BACT|nr:tetratricopeptide repeat protein [Xanthocytophaga flavus]MDJ1472954.1 tetratricopeptide repeat protein [Xanthocytophaga flavus]MDJ1492367.1 tetratricopeptide repeat protein [Xanthocytophaga flavus]